MAPDPPQSRDVTPAVIASVVRSVFKRYETRTQTNWHYECAKALLAGTVTL
jgi:hypothetical protein